jgi:hypothetical protein
MFITANGSPTEHPSALAWKRSYPWSSAPDVAGVAGSAAACVVVVAVLGPAGAASSLAAAGSLPPAVAAAAVLGSCGSGVIAGRVIITAAAAAPPDLRSCHCSHIFAQFRLICSSVISNGETFKSFALREIFRITRHAKQLDDSTPNIFAINDVGLS